MKFAFVGNPNCGKTTLFNALTGSTAHVGNWPGVTVEKKEGVYKKLPEKVTLVDLPGIYSLSPYTPEEIVSRKFILEEKPDVIVDIVDATNLIRNLYLTTQLVETDIPVIIALNMSDLLEKRGLIIDREMIERVFGVKVIPVSALKSHNIHTLMKEAYSIAGKEKKSFTAIENYVPLYREVYALYENADADNKIFRAVKMLEGDEPESRRCAEIHSLTEKLKKGVDTGVFEGDYEGVVADARYKFLERELEGVIKMADDAPKVRKSVTIDRVMTHKIWGIPIFLVIMLGVFHLTFSNNLLGLGLFIPDGSFDIPIIGKDAINAPGTMLAEAMVMLTDMLGGMISGALPAGTWYTGLIVDGICGGLFSVLSFIPQILFLFLFLSILEDSGYMARVAFILDRAFRKFGLSGRAFMPFVMCFGCAVPGIMATRTLENAKERRISIMLAPFFSCGAKLPIWACFGAVLFNGAYRDLVVYGIYLLGIVVALVSALILNKATGKGEVSPFLMELPDYRLPQFKNTMLYLWDKLKHYIVKAGTIIIGAIIVIWFLSNFGFAFWKGMTSEENSIIGIISKGISWLFVPLGFGMGADGWKFVVAVFTGFIAKEMVVATLGTFAGVDDAVDMESGDLASSALGLMISGMAGGVPAALAFMAFNLLCMPCMAAVSAALGEFNNRKNFWLTILYWFAVAYVVSLVIFWSGRYPWLIAVFAGVATIVVAAIYTVKKVKARRAAKGE